MVTTVTINLIFTQMFKITIFISLSKLDKSGKTGRIILKEINNYIVYAPK